MSTQIRGGYHGDYFRLYAVTASRSRRSTRGSFDNPVAGIELDKENNMRFLSLIRVDETAGRVPSEQLMEDMGKLMDEMSREGALIRTAGLRPTSEGARVRLRHGKLSAVDGPFTETKEVIGGFAILEAKSMPDAIELTKRFLQVHGAEWDIECEVRPIDGPEFGIDA